MCAEPLDKIIADKDYSNFFHDPEFQARYPGLKLPPPSFIASGAKIQSFESGKSITLVFLVREHQRNPIGTLQGGILCSFIDDAFGTLSFASLRKPCVSVDMTVNFIRPIRPGESGAIRAEFKSKNRKLLQLYAEAHNGKDKLAAKATSDMMVSDLQ
jgi:uncharacterized protein (TIGR00369 family)